MSKHQIGYIGFGLFTIFYGFAYFLYDFPLGYYLIAFFVWISLVAIGSFTVRCNYHINAISSFKTPTNQVAITFDDGPSEFTDGVLDVLKKYDAKASFFCIGKHLEKFPDQAKRIVSEGHALGNHTYSHSKIGFTKKEVMVDEITQTDDLIEAYTERKSTLFRPPFGVTNPMIRRALLQTKHHVIGWNIRSLDTAIHDEKKVLNRITRQLKPGSIILLHDTAQQTSGILEQLLLYLREHNFTCVSIEEILKK